MPTIPCHHCGYDLNGVPLVDGLRHCPECGKESPLGASPRPRWIERIWILPASVAIVQAMSFAWLAGRFGDSPPPAVDLDALVFLGIPIAAVANGVMAFGTWVYIYRRHPIENFGSGKSIARAYCIGALVAVLTFVLAAAGVFSSHSR